MASSRGDDGRSPPLPLTPLIGWEQEVGLARARLARRPHPARPAPSSGLRHDRRFVHAGGTGVTVPEPHFLSS